ncbi:hypothetical protein [Bacillus glycinifermentans]|uniref:hypothetical protein n=1 Tax=Bacillus glycinifermentans TaxID=1664069 RepID=UPI001FF6E6C4|nr:hypothetical protein [Bacillus glycinifermentans]UOY87729.1 hypothetical protein MW696_16895 [Bacillus glycinifermentans]
MKRAEGSVVEQSGVQAAAGICFMVVGTMCFASKSIFVNGLMNKAHQLLRFYYTGN